MSKAPIQTIHLQDINEEVFSRFGHVFKPVRGAKRINHSDIAVNLRESAELIFAQVLADDLRKNNYVCIEMLEKHPYSSQSFFPLDVNAYLVVVCESDEHGTPLLHTLKAFKVPGDTSVTYKENVWHTGMASIDGGRSFTMLVYEDGTKDDCIFLNIDPFKIKLR